MSEFHLNREEILRQAEKAGLSRETVGMLGDYCMTLKGWREEAFGSLLSDFLSGGPLSASEEIPEPFRTLPEPGLFFLALTLAGIPAAEAHFRKQKLPVEVLHEGLADLRIWCEDHRNNFHLPGMEWQMGLHWMFRIYSGQVLRFGRLECNRAFFFSDAAVFRNRRDGKILTVIHGEIALNKDGFAAFPEETAVCRSAPMRNVFDGISAFPVRSDGSVCPEPVLLKAGEWEPVLRPGDPSLYLHIPADGPLDPAECRKSLLRMYEFFVSRNYRPLAAVCSTWFLDASIGRLAGEESNLAAFRKLGQLLGPSRAERTDVIRRVFGTDGIRPLPRMTKLQRGLTAFLESGGHFRGGRIIIDFQSLIQGDHT